MPKVSDQYVEAKQQQILDAAIICFARNGFEATTIEDICREAGVSHGVVYRYFQNKEEIIEASFRREFEARLVRYSDTLRETSARKLLEGFLSGYFRRRLEPEAETLMKFRMQMYGETVRNPSIGEMWRRGQEEILQKTVEIVCSAQEKGEINPHLDALAVARMVGALADGFYVQRSITPDLDVKKCAEAAEAIFFGNFWLIPGKEENNGSKD